VTARLILVRHGESMSNVLRIVTSALDGFPLTGRGQAQAAAAAALLVDDGVVRLYSSEAQRARETAAIIAETLGVPVTTVAGLEEIHVGVLEGRPEAEVVSDGALTNFERWLSVGDLAHGFEGGENALQAAARVRAPLEDIAARHDGDTVVVVSHGGSLALSLVELCDNVTPRFAWEHLLDNCDAVVVTVDADRWTCVSWAGVAPADEPRLRREA
jgi:probable phosphoglycerate mutase